MVEEYMFHYEGHIGTYRNIWARLGTFGHVWEYLGTFGYGLDNYLRGDYEGDTRGLGVIP